MARNAVWICVEEKVNVLQSFRGDSWKAERCLKDVIVTPFSVDLETSQEKPLAGKQANLLKKVISFQWRKAGKSTKFERSRSDCSPAIKCWWVSSSLTLIWFGCCSFLFSLILEFQVLAGFFSAFRRRFCKRTAENVRTCEQVFFLQ